MGDGRTVIYSVMHTQLCGIIVIIVNVVFLLPPLKKVRECGDIGRQEEKNLSETSITTPSAFQIA